MFLTAFHGLAMALADSVPGVSGGTVGFILGFYDRFILSINDLLSKDKAARRKAILYLLNLGIGWVIGLVASMLLLSALFEKHVYVLCSAFIGLSLAAVPFIVIAEIAVIKGKYYNLVFTLLGAALVVGISLLRELDFMSGQISFVDGLRGWQYLYVFLAGMAAISAMILPGISGSTILLVFGCYLPLLEAIKEVFRFNFSFRMISGILVMAAGIVVGALLAVKGIKAALLKFRSQTVYTVLGLLLGSAYAIAQGPLNLKPSQEGIVLTQGLPNSLRIIPLIVGALILVGLELLRFLIEKKSAPAKAAAAASNEAGVSGIDAHEEASTGELASATSDDGQSSAPSDDVQASVPSDDGRPDERPE
ncbi:MAG: DUF368 domain-containing protein [Clostridia bacterium]|nr:DUF368 domain-containing protein [Clostridia bacterium]